MTDAIEPSNERLRSTRWYVRHDKLSDGAATANAARSKSAPSRRLARRNPRKPLNATLKWRGGAGAWIQVESRGGVWRIPGDTFVADLVLFLNDEVRIYPGEDR